PDGSEFAAEGAVLEGGEEGVELRQRLPHDLLLTQYDLHLRFKLLLHAQRRQRELKLANDLHVQAGHHRTSLVNAETVKHIGMHQQGRLQIRWKTAALIQRDATQVLRIDSHGHIVRDDDTSATGSHDGDQHVASSYAVALKLL